MEISVLICTYNRPVELLDAVLKSLIDDSFDKPDELVVINGGDERADRIVRKFMGRGVNIKLVNTINKNLAASRNIGLAYCSKEIVALTDDDAQVFPDWIARMKEAHVVHPEAGAIGGAVIGINTESLVTKVADLETFPSWEKPQYVRTLPGVNISYKRAVVNEVGLQDENFFRGEDVDYNWRVKQLGYEIYFDPKIKVYHFHRPTLMGLLNQHFMYGRSYYLVRRKWPDMNCIYPRQMTNGRDVVKLARFWIAPFFKSLTMSLRLNSAFLRILGAPLILAVRMTWRLGIIVQAFLECVPAIDFLSYKHRLPDQRS